MPLSSGMTLQRSKAEGSVVHLGGGEHPIARSRLGTYIDLNNATEALVEAVDAGDNGAIAHCLFEYLSLAIPDLDRGVYESAPWFEVVYAVMTVRAVNTIPQADQYAILNTKSDGKQASVPWDYPGRRLMVWKHILASAYGWTLEEIDNLWPEQAVMLLMEIMVDEQIDMEFAHSLSENAYEYDKATKKSRYKPLRRPLWMVSGSEENQEARRKGLITQLRRDTLPQGLVIGDGNLNQEK